MFQLTRAVIDPRRVEAAVTHPGAGAVVTFHGIVRDNNLGRAVQWLEYEAYPEMAEPRMSEIGEEVRLRWPGARLGMVHRLGRLEIGEASVVIAASAAHRADAFEACRFAIDNLKTTVPIWKKEVWSDGSAWVEGAPTAPLA